MSSAIQKAISEIKFQIPIEILQIAFTENSQHLNQMISLDDRILSSIIRPRVMVDANLVGGIETRISLNDCNISAMNNREFVVDIPKSLTSHRSIVSVLSLVSNVVYQQSTAYSEMPAGLSSAMNMMNNLGTENVVQTARLEIIGDGIVLVQDPTIHLVNGVLRCIVENGKNMENLNPRSYLAFSKLCILATKSYIYNSLLIKIDKGYIYGGHELGVIKDVIDSYNGAEELYQEYLNTTFRKVAFINDSDKMSRYITSMISNTI